MRLVRVAKIVSLTDSLLLLQFTGSGLSNFYGRFCNDSTHNKPMVITETSAMYNPSNTAGSTDLAIKQNWWQQVFNVQGDTSGVRPSSISPHQKHSQSRMRGAEMGILVLVRV